MLYYLTLFLIFWALIYTAARFLRYYRIVREYKNETTATVASVSNHEQVRKNEPPAVDVILEFSIDGEKKRSEIIVPAEKAGEYEVGKAVDICYYVAGNGAVHIASAGDGPKKMMYGYLAAIVIELVIYYVVWRILL